MRRCRNEHDGIFPARQRWLGAQEERALRFGNVTGPGVTNPTFSGATNNTNAAKSITANFPQLGNYTFEVQMSAGSLFVDQWVNVSVAQGAVIAVAPASASVPQGQAASSCHSPWFVFFVVLNAVKRFPAGVRG
jgi:hypothetical protein